MSKINRSLILSGFVFLLSLVLQVSAFAQSGGIKGKVRTSGGSGISNATVTAQKDGRDVRSVRSDAKGNFLMRGLEGGVYNVVFDASGYATGVKYGVEVKRGVKDLGDRLILSVDKGTQVILNGSVFFKEGTSVTGAKVEIERVNPDGTTKDLGSGYTNVSGEFTFRQPEGAAKLRVTAKYKGASGTKEIEVEGAAIYRLAITIDISRREK